MDYRALSEKMLSTMQSLQKERPQRFINESLQGEAFVLKFITDGDEGVLPGKIGDKMGVSSARVAAALKSLEKKGLVTRRIDLKDRRKILVEATEEGLDLARSHYELAVEFGIRMLSLLGDEDAAEYVRISCKLADILGRINS